MIVEALVKLLIAEHKRKPITGKILALGKQTVSVPLSRLIEIFKEQNCPINPSFDQNAIKRDEATRMRDKDSIDDEAFFQMFGDITYQTMDVTAYERASLIHDLNYPIAETLESQFDFIVDGGTFDHLFDIKQAFINVVKLLKTGGRIFQWNAASNYANAGYLSFSADFFYDFYVLNKFQDCRTYFADSFLMGAQNWNIYEFIPQSSGYLEFRKSFFYTMVLVFAEKGADSTSDRMPIQLQYRDAAIRKEYQENAKLFEGSTARLQVKSEDLGFMMRQKIGKWHKLQILLYNLLPHPDKSAYRHIGWL